jgi:hypothetical protein
MVELPLSAGRTVSRSLLFKERRALRSAPDRLFLDTRELLRILTVSCRISSADSIGKARIAEHVQTVFQNTLNYSERIYQHVSNFTDSDTSALLDKFVIRVTCSSGFLVDGHPERSESSTEVAPFLNFEIHSKLVFF